MSTALRAQETQQTQDPARLLHVLFSERYAWELREDPALAMSRGDYSNAGRLRDESLEAIERRQIESQRHLERLLAIDRAALTPPDQTHYDLFRLILENQTTGHRFRTHLAPIGGRHGPQQSIPQMHEHVRFSRLEDYEPYLLRMEQIPVMVEQVLARLKLGLEEGRTPPQITLRGVPDQFKALLQESGLNHLAQPFDRLPESIARDKAMELKHRFGTVSLPAVRSAVKQLGEFVANEYVPRCRQTIAAQDWPEGAAYYAHQLKVFTTTDLTAEQIHQTGLQEVARIRAEMLSVIRSSDFMALRPESGEWDETVLFGAFLEYLRSDGRFYYTKEADLLAGYRDVCKRIDPWLPRLFRTLPRLTYGVRAIPEFMAPSQTTAYYLEGNIDNAEPGWFYANTFALDQRPRYEMTALALHEAVPGHHFQIALAQELKDLPEFRRYADFTVFIEGWALYAERLGLEMELFEDPYDNFGRLLYEMWRACRLVVDPGIHALGWTRQRAIDFMLENTALSRLNIETEVDRYIAWPGQATAYKIGELRIRELRKQAEDALGDQFDVRSFHDVLLSAGAVPLNVLQQRVETWIAEQGRGATAVPPG